METIIEHLQDNHKTYIALLVCSLPLIYLTKKYSLPTILYTIETAIYLSLMHLSVWLIVSLTRWFKEESTMRALREDGTLELGPDWGTPLLEFWHTDAYTPFWLMYAEIIFAIAIIVLVWRYRPMKIQKKSQRQIARERSAEQRRNINRSLPGNHNKPYNY